VRFGETCGIARMQTLSGEREHAAIVLLTAIWAKTVADPAKPGLAS
jgi:hypothetical protein